MSALPDLVEPLKRATAPLGAFSDVFPEATDGDIEELLLDAFSEAQLDGFLSTYTATDDGEVTPDLTRGQGALIVLYASRRLLFNEIRNRKTHVRYEAGAVVFEEDQSVSVLVKLLDELSGRLAAVLTQAQTAAFATEVYVVDQYFQRLAAGGAVLGWTPHALEVG